MQGCSLSAWGFTPALVTIYNLKMSPEALYFEWEGHLEGKAVWTIPALISYKTEQMDFEGWHSYSCSHQKVAISWLGVCLFSWESSVVFRLVPNCRWPSVETLMQRSTLSSGIKKILAPVPKLRARFGIFFRCLQWLSSLKHAFFFYSCPYYQEVVLHSHFSGGI